MNSAGYVAQLVRIEIPIDLSLNINSTNSEHNVDQLVQHFHDIFFGVFVVGIKIQHSQQV